MGVGHQSFLIYKYVQIKNVLHTYQTWEQIKGWEQDSH
jgi:hypothetical protein